jgi:hypothetical protein
MGHRANLVIVENQEHQLFYSHWCANSLDRNLFWGVEHSLAFIRLQEEVNELGWLDEVWAEGGVVVDLDNKILLLFGGEDLIYDILLRHFYLQLIQQVWRGWTVKWAYQGIVDIAGYVGHFYDRVVTNTENTYSLNWNILEQQEWIDTNTVGSFEFNNGEICLFPLSFDLTYYLYAGSQIINSCQKEKGNNCEVSPWALKDARLELSVDERRQILMSALAAIKSC